MKFDDRESIFEDKFSIIFRISLCPASVSLTLLPIDSYFFSNISAKSLSEILGMFTVLRFEDSSSPIELVKESLLAFLLEDLSGIFDYSSVLGFEEFLFSRFPLNEKKLKFSIFIEYQSEKLTKFHKVRILATIISEISLGFQLYIPSAHVKRGNIHNTFTLHSARRPSKARKPEVQFRFVELRLSVCSCFPRKARVDFLSELRLRFPLPPILASLGHRS